MRQQKGRFVALLCTCFLVKQYISIGRKYTSLGYTYTYIDFGSIKKGL